MSRAAVAAMATTGKTAAAENFPVASLLLSAAVRAKVMAFYRFARHADDIADDPALPPEEKLAVLDALDKALKGREGSSGVVTALEFRDAVGADPLLIEHASQLLQAFRRDTVSSYCRDWGDLMAYCRCSAAPVGRFLLDLHGEHPDSFAAGDALCAALQVLNHLQDCGKDFRALGRVYIPRDWLLMAGLTNRVFEGERTDPELRAVLDLVLDAVDGLIELARSLPAQIADRRLRLQAAVTLAAAERLSELLRARDPLADRVELGPLDFAGAFVAGIFRGLTV